MESWFSSIVTENHIYIVYITNFCQQSIFNTKVKGYSLFMTLFLFDIYI